MPEPTIPLNSPGLRLLARFPEDVRSAYTRYIEERDVAAADFVLMSVLGDHLPSDRRVADPLSLPDESRLMEDLGFDSLAIAEVVFFLEDLYRLRVPQEHLQSLTRVADLRAYLRKRLESSAN